MSDIEPRFTSSAMKAGLVYVCIVFALFAIGFVRTGSMFAFVAAMVAPVPLLICWLHMMLWVARRLDPIAAAIEIVTEIESSIKARAHD